MVDAELRVVGQEDGPSRCGDHCRLGGGLGLVGGRESPPYRDPVRPDECEVDERVLEGLLRPGVDGGQRAPPDPAATVDGADQALEQGIPDPDGRGGLRDRDTITDQTDEPGPLRAGHGDAEPRVVRCDNRGIRSRRARCQQPRTHYKPLNGLCFGRSTRVLPLANW